jgi:hypothetical protein
VTSSSSDSRTRVELVAAVVVIPVCAILAYVSTLDNYFVRDDFGVVQLLAQKPASYFPRWFSTSWMDQIWGFTPDEIRPFPAVSYQLTALGGAASPFLHHALNILIHAANGLIVMAIARTAAGLSMPAAGLAGLFFVVLPVHAESVAWITGRVDSMPALFYLASFLAYVEWRRSGSRSIWIYLSSVAFFFVALFTKQNTITMVATLAAYDLVVLRQRLVPVLTFVRPYLPFVALTVGYLWLRYQLFGQVAREGALNAQGLADFAVLFNRHLTHVVTGDMNGWRIVVWLALAAVSLLWAWCWRQERRTSHHQQPGVACSRLLFYFGPIWWLIGIAPVLVAGYSSPRHVYLAAVGWAMVIAIGFDVFRRVTLNTPRHRLLKAAVLVAFLMYQFSLSRAVSEWNTMAAVSHRAVLDVQRVALAAPEGSLLVVGAPTRSWEWALPFSVRPPFTTSDLTERVFIISPRPLSCCSGQWFDGTKDTLRRWAEGERRDSAVAMRWDADSGALFRATDADTPQLPVLARALVDLDRPEDLDRNLIRLLDVLPLRVR